MISNIYLFEMEREKENCHLLVHAPVACDGLRWGWVWRWQPGMQSRPATWEADTQQLEPFVLPPTVCTGKKAVSNHNWELNPGPPVWAAAS